MRLRTVCVGLLLLTGPLFVPVEASAQALFSKDSKITVAPHTTITVGGNVENNGVLVNNGSLRVQGGWTNSGTYRSDEGEVIFDGSSPTFPQIIHQNGQSFNRVTLAGGGKKVILSDMVVRSEMHFEDGLLETAGSARVIFDTAVVISGASDRSHIYGPVYHKGAGMKLFPIGNASYYLPVTLLDVADSAALVGVHAFEFDHAALQKSDAMPSISDRRYWYIDVAKGSLTESRVALPYRDESWAFDRENLVVAQAPALADRFTSLGRSLLERESDRMRVTSGKGVTMPFVTLATVAHDNPLIVYNAVSPNGDGQNDFLRIENIESFPRNKFSLFNRWGDKVFETENYNNSTNVFKGWSNDHGQLVSGTYYYVLEIPGTESLRGFITVKY